jgi:acyl carrier protein
MNIQVENEVLRLLNVVLTNNGKMNIEAISPSMSLRSDIGLDSFEMAEFTVIVEAEFGIDVFEDGIVNTIAEVFKKLNKNS